MPTHQTPPWKKPAPKKSASTKLTPKSIAEAKAAARKAGRRYPNLIDNMAAARRQRERSDQAADRNKTGRS